MSNEDQYGGGVGSGYGEVGGTGQTRTRLPDAPSDPYGTPRRAPRASRGLVTVVGVVVLLIAAIAFANQSSDSPRTPADQTPPAATSTSATGTRPVDGKNGAIPKGFAHDEQGAQSAAANYAVALVSADILKPQMRRQIVRQVFVADKVSELEARLDQAYGKTFLDQAGLDANGNAAQGLTYISRTVPVGTKAAKNSESTTTVDVWCTGVFGTAGVGSTNPVSNDWFTMTLTLRWAENDWKVESFAQKDGPAPVHTDRTASTAEEIAKAATEFGGFTYAR
ncbi:hypothetical protein [Streptomyces sp. NBC_01296]|uniref:hypothetical protein n=1 Tax=Streptomyces sp. NBC_01296 TaxID=2903816 RepID=UPI002E106193|nr:hypothetical protein OG299_21720 [Streptomyces sp. NBC_01296]